MKFSSQKRATRTARKIIITALIMLALFFIAGVIYVWFSGQTTNQQTKTTQTKPTTQPLPSAFTPHGPNPKAPVGVALESLETPVVRGSNTGINIKTTPGASCTISVKYGEKVSKDSGLITKTADIYGLVSWTWTVDKDAPVGIWPVKITCAYNKKSGVYIGNLQVTK